VGATKDKKEADKKAAEAIKEHKALKKSEDEIKRG